MKTFRIILVSLLLVMISIISFYTFNLIFSLVSNYAAVTLVTMSCVPMVMFLCELVAFCFGFFNYFILKRKDVYIFRKYSIIIASFALIGIVFSIICGTLIYHSFVGDYVFNSYPLLMLIIHTLLFVLGTYKAVISCLEIKKYSPQKEWEIPKFYWIRETFIIVIFVFALERLGAFLLLPIYFSSYDGIYVLPLYIQLLVPALALATYMIHEHWLHNRKVTLVLSSIAFGYTVFSMIYMLVISKNNYPLITNPLSPIMQLERLTVYPVGFIALYGFSLLVSGLNLGNNLVMSIKEKRKN